VRRSIACNCLIVCSLFSSSLSFAQNLSPKIPALPEQTAELQNAALTQSPDPNTSVSETASGTQNTVATSDPQSVARASSSGSSNSSGNSNSSGSSNSSGTGSAATTPYVFPSSGEVNRYWLLATVGPKALAGGAFTASWNTWVNTSPNEWHQDGAGWSKRFGSALLDNGINTSTLVLWSRAMHQDPMYSRCGCSGAWARTTYAFKMTFMSRNRSGDLTFSPAKIGSPFTGPMVTRNTIYPDSFGWGDAATGGAYYQVGRLAWNLIREFVWNMPH
jgi:hypothetical protein